MKKVFYLILVIVLSLCLCLSACSRNPSETETPSGDTNKPNNPNTDAEVVFWGKLSGIVTENDKPCQGVTVTSGSKTTTTDVDGKYTIDVYSDGAKVVFTKDGYITQSNTFKASSFSAEQYTYSFNIFRSVKVSGQVVDENGSAVAQAIVTIGIRSVQTDSDGRFVMNDVIGTSMMVFAEKGKQKAQKPIFTDEMQSGTVEIELILR